MNQINSDQIVDNGIPDGTIKPIPRDLADVKTSSTNKSGLGFINNVGASDGSGSPLPIPSNPTSPGTITPPDTPGLIGIKSQTVKIKDDGTYAVDVIIDVEDIRNVSEYEVRISKGAGSI